MVCFEEQLTSSEVMMVMILSSLLAGQVVLNGIPVVGQPRSCIVITYEDSLCYVEFIRDVQFFFWLKMFDVLVGQTFTYSDLVSMLF